MKKAKSNYEKRQESKAREFKIICKSLGITKTIRRYGLTKTLWALTKYVLQQRELAALQRERAATTKKLNEIEAKIEADLG